MEKSVITPEMKSKILDEIGKLVKARAKSFVPVDRGVLLGSIDYKIEGDTVTIYAAAPYAEDMEFGKPPEVLSEREREDIRGWVHRHHGAFGFSPGSQKGTKAEINIARHVANKIEKEGLKVGTITKPYEDPNGRYRPFMRPALHQSMPMIRQIVKDVIRGAV